MFCELLPELVFASECVAVNSLLVLDYSRLEFDNNCVGVELVLTE